MLLSARSLPFFATKNLTAREGDIYYVASVLGKQSKQSQYALTKRLSLILSFLASSPFVVPLLVLLQHQRQTINTPGPLLTVTNNTRLHTSACSKLASRKDELHRISLSCRSSAECVGGNLHSLRQFPFLYLSVLLACIKSFILSLSPLTCLSCQGKESIFRGW